MEYKVLESFGLPKLVIQVNDWIAAGWTPLGGMVTGIDSNVTKFYQTMIKKEKK